MGDSLLKHLNPEAADMEIEAEWYKQTKIMIIQEEKVSGIEQEEIGNIDWLIETSTLNRTEKKT